jgi:CBS domain-containing protein
MSIREERDHVVGTLQSEKNLEAKGDRVSMGGGGKDVLRKVPVGDYCAHKQLRFAVKTDSVMEVVALLQQEGIQSVPVLDVQKQKHFAFADVLDVLVHTLAVYDEWKATAMDDAAVQQRFSSLDAASLAGLSGQSPFQTISSNTPTSIAIDKFSKFRVRRLPIVDDDGKVIMVRLLSLLFLLLKVLHFL